MLVERIATHGIAWVCALLLVVSSSTTGCAGSRYHSNAHFDTEYDFSQVDTYAFQVQREKVSESSGGRVLEQSIRRQLGARGYEEVPVDRADVLVSYDLGRYAPAKLSGSNSFAITEATLMVSVLDPATKRTVWYGSVETRLRPDDEQSVIDEALAALFAERIPNAPGH